MFNSIRSVVVFAAGVILTMGLILSPHLSPGGWGHGLGLNWPLWIKLFSIFSGAAALAITLWFSGSMIKGASNWKQSGVLIGIFLIAFIANMLFVLIVELFALKSGFRALIAVAGVPVIYGNLGAVLGKVSLKESMVKILEGALATMGAGYIIASIIKGW